MRRRRRHPAHSHPDRWLVSYADFITLLFAFFVVLYASSQVDKRKVGKLAVAIQAAFQQMGAFPGSPAEAPTNINVNQPIPSNAGQTGENKEPAASWRRSGSVPGSAADPGLTNADLERLQAELESALALEIKRKEIALRRTSEGLIVSLREAGFFESGAAQMKSSSQTAFDSIASTLRQRDYPLRIEGYTDNIPIHTSQFPSNWELSTSRATEIVRLLIIRDGFSPDRLSAAGFAEYHPVASNVTAEGRGMNRRVDIVILSHAPGEASPAQGETQNPAQNLIMSPAERKTAAPAAPPAPPAPKPSAGIPAVDHRPLQP